MLSPVGGKLIRMQPLSAKPAATSNPAFKQAFLFSCFRIRITG